MYIKISNSVGRNDNFLATVRKLSILPTELNIFDIRQHYIRIPYLSTLSIKAHIVELNALKKLNATHVPTSV